MTKQDLIGRVWERIYRNHGSSSSGSGGSGAAGNSGASAAFSKKAVQELVEMVFDELADYFVKAKLSKSEVPRFTYPSFGTFTKRKRPERTGRNPRTGAAIRIPSTYTLAFAPGQDLKAALNKLK
jgi:nucleoid DNA-binding protein